MTDVTLRPFSRSDINWLVDEHQRAYSRDEGFDDTFGPLVREILEGFAANHDPFCEAGWIATRGADRLGSIFCVRLAPDVAKLRIFYIVPEARGLGLGHRLLQTCLNFARDAGYGRMELWTHESHNAACALYDKYGFEVTNRKDVTSFGVPMVELTYARNL